MADFANVQPDEYKLLGRNFSAGRPLRHQGRHHPPHGRRPHRRPVQRHLGCQRLLAHYSVDRNGYIVQHVNDTDRAYACGDGIGTGRGNDTTISIEHANSGSNPWTVHEKAIESGAHLVAALCLYYGLGRPEWCKNVFPHRYWSATACPGELAGSQRDHYMQRAKAWYDAMKDGKAPAPSTAAKPAAANPVQAASGGFSKASGKRIPVHYSLHLKGGGWLDEVTDFGAGDNGFAGYPCRQHDLLCAESIAARSSIRYILSRTAGSITFPRATATIPSTVAPASPATPSTAFACTT